MNSAVMSHQKFFGLLELDAGGTVLYSRIESDGNGADSTPTMKVAPDMMGRNFYSEVAPFQNVEEFHRRLDSFRNSSQQANSFEFDCDYEDGTVAVRVLLARISERSDARATKSLLVHIRKAR
jgi:hypothetical protein